MRRFIAALAAALTLAAALAGLAQGDVSEYGIEAKSVSASASTNQVGAHPDFSINFELNREPGGELPSTTLRTSFDLPPGLLGNPNAVPTCSAAELIETDPEDPSNEASCPQASQVGITEVHLFNEGGETGFIEPVFNMEPRQGEPARFGFITDVYPVFVDIEVRPDRQYAVTARVEGISSLIPLLGASTTLWGVPADESHDAQRDTPYEAVHNHGVPETPSGKRAAGLVPVPFMRNPTRCGQAQGITITATPYEMPDLLSKAFAPLPPNNSCGLLDFSPNLSISPTTSQVETGSGLDADLTFPQEGLQHPNLPGEADQKRVEVTLPEGVTVNPSQAEGLGVCSEADFARETFSSGPNEGCPETSKIGTVTAASPLVNELAEGALFVAKPRENPFGTLIALYLVLKIPDRGVIVKLPGKVTPDPKTGQLVTTFGEAPYEVPQLPVSSFKLHFREGARSPLVTPPHCGVFRSDATFTSWAGQVVTTHPSFEITAGVGGAACPAGGAQPFHPGFEAGAINNDAGAFSPYYLRLTRGDGEQDLTKVSTTLPPGSLAKLAGVSQCQDSQISAAGAKTGREELAAPSCPANSEIGHVLAGAGVGSVLTYVSGKIYLAGPYKGAPLSIAVVVPAVAGPFDVGTVVTRVGLTVNPETGLAEVDGSKSDPIPHILAGIPLKVRDVRVYVDRPNFNTNPTSCDPEAFQAQLWGGGSDVFSSLDDSPVSLSQRFQAANCSLLGFKPSLSLTLHGGTGRGAHPALRGVFRPRPGDANLRSLRVTLPHSAFLEQAHIRTVCTRVQFAAGAGNGAGCPPGSVYGRAVAYSPLLEEPLKGPVFLRSSSHKLPDLVLALHGIVDFDAVGRIDATKGRLRSTFETVPDAPLSKVVLEMQGAKKGLIVNSTDLCARSHRAIASLDAHNGKVRGLRPTVGDSCRAAKRHRRVGDSSR